MRTRTKQKRAGRLCQWLFVIATGMFITLCAVIPKEVDAQSTNGLTLIASHIPVPSGLTLGPHQRLFVSDSSGGDVYRLLTTGTLRLEAGGFESPRDILFDQSGNLYVADAAANKVYRLDRQGNTAVIADNLISPCCLAFDATGNLLVSHFLASADGESPYNGAVTRISTQGQQTLIASGFLDPQGLLVDRENNILIAAEGFFDPYVGAVSTVIGSGLFKIDELGQVTRILDVGSITPSGLALSSQGSLFFSGVTPQEGGVFVTGGGTFEPFVTGLTQPRGMAIDEKALYVADEKAGQVWRIDLNKSSAITNQVQNAASTQGATSNGTTSSSSEESSAQGADPVVAKQFEEMWGYHGAPDYSKIPVTPEGTPQAPPGVTCVIGQVNDHDDNPLANVTVRLGRKATRSNSSGQWMLVDVPAGYQVHMIDGRSADHGGTHYPIAMVGWELRAKQANVLPYEAYLPVLDTAHTTKIDWNKETVHTTPLIPGLEIHVPAHTKITSVDGTPVTEITATRVPYDEPIYPMGLVRDFGNHFTLQPGGAFCSKDVRVVYSNPAKYPPGTPVQLWEYAPMTHGGWYKYGVGKVTDNDLQIEPQANAGFNTFGCGLSSHTEVVVTDDRGGHAAEPVDLASGVFQTTATDLVVPGLMPIVFGRVYRNQDSNVPGQGQYVFGVNTLASFEFRISGNPFGATNSAWLDFNVPSDTSYRFSYLTNAPVQTYVCTNDYRFGGARIYQFFTSGGKPIYSAVMKDGTKYDFDYIGDLTAIRDANNNTLSIDRGSIPGGNVLSMTQPSGRSISFTYNNSGLISLATDSAGRSVGYVYDSSNRLVTVTNAIGGVTQHTYDGSNNLTSVTLPNTNLYLQNFYDGGNRVTNQIVAGSAVYSISYTIKTTLVTVVSSSVSVGGVPRIVINNNDSGFATNRADALGHTNIYVRGANNEVLKSIDPLGRTNTYVYDANFNLVAITNALNKVTKLTYEPVFNQLTSTIDPIGHTNSFGYDGQGNLTSITNPLGKVTTITYNQAGLATTVTDPLGNTTTFSYNAQLDLISVTDPLGNHAQSLIDSAGRPYALIDSFGRLTKLSYNALNHVTVIVNSLGTNSYAYDAVGNMTNSTDALNHTVFYGYDSMFRLTSRKDQLGKIETVAYDNNGNLTNHVDRRGLTDLFKYNSLSFPTGVVYGTQSNVRYLYDKVNRVTNVVDSVAGSTRFFFDKLDRVTNVVDVNGTISYGYNDIGLRTNMTVAGENTVFYKYDNGNRLTNVTQGTFTSSLFYDDLGRRTKLVLPNGMNVLYSYDTLSRLTNITYQGAATNRVDYAYDQNGNRRARASALSVYILPAAVTNSSYDFANRQLTFSSYALQYDADGNLTNLINGATTNNLMWNARGQLTNITGGVTANFVYDGLGRRITRTVGGLTEKYVYDGSDVIQQLDGSGTVAADYFRSPGLDEPWQRIDVTPGTGHGTTTTNRIYLAEGIGSVLALTDTNQALQTQYAYEPFGATTTTGSSNKNSYQFTAREDDGTGFYCYRTRYYSPALGRLISEDPAGGDDNLYAYCGNNPINAIDPLGLTWIDLTPDEWDVARFVGGGIVGASERYLNILTLGLYGWAARHSGGCYNTGGFNAPFSAGYQLGSLWVNTAVITYALVESGVGAVDGAGAIPNGGMCFAAGTKVATPQGEKNIEDIEIGETVYAYDLETRETVERKVTDTPRNFTYYWVEVRVGNETIEATRHHLFWVENEERWVEAVNLQGGMSVRFLDGKIETISAVFLYELQQSETTYNLVVEGVHDFFVGKNSVLVHNGYPESPMYPPPTPVGGNFQFNFDTSLNYANSRRAGVNRAISGGYVDPDDGPFHHINSVDEYPNLAAEPSNIEGQGSLLNHLDTHDGNWRNPTSGPLNSEPGC